MKHSTFRTAGLGMGIALLATAGLTGCVTVEPQDNESASAPITTNSSPVQSTEGTPTAASPTGEASTAAPQSQQTSSNASFNDIFAQISDQAEQTLKCEDDDEAGREDADDLLIEQSAMFLHLTGDCDDVVITGNELTIAAEEIDDLIIRGDNNVITVKDLDDVELRGSGNFVGWNPEFEDDVDVADSGANNQVGANTVTADKVTS